MLHRIAYLEKRLQDYGTRDEGEHSKRDAFHIII